MPAKFDKETVKELSDNARRIATPGKGILAADESTGTIGKRFAGIKVENTEKNRADYRELLFKSKGFGEFISGVILYEETLYQKASTGETMVQLLEKENVLPGIKTDLGVVALPGTNDEKATQGLDGLAERCKKYYEKGARFAKWRAVLSIDSKTGKPSDLSISETAHTLARYAVITQTAKLVPIVEPEVLSDGDHSIQVTAEVTEKVLAAVFHELNKHHVLLEGCLLKPNMVLPGSSCSCKSNPNEVAYYTIRTLMRTVPPALVGVVFLSGGQSEEEATCNLNAMNSSGKATPWSLSFSYGRALQASCLQAWSGKKENVANAQKTFLQRAKANSQAQLGKYVSTTDSSVSKKNLFEANYSY